MLLCEPLTYDAPFKLDLTGKHVLITGANQGIGYATAKQLASQKANVHMVCRSKERGEAALAKLRAEVVEQSGGAVDGSGVRLHVCDISSMAAVKALSEAYVRGGDPLHVLVNNAGCMVHERTLTPEGVEANFATNTLGTWALTEGGGGVAQCKATAASIKRFKVQRSWASHHHIYIVYRYTDFTRLFQRLRASHHHIHIVYWYTQPRLDTVFKAFHRPDIIRLSRVFNDFFFFFQMERATLARGLMPALRKAAAPTTGGAGGGGGEARVVTVSSAGMLTEKLELNDVEMKKGRFDGTRQYAVGKRHQVALTQRWARLHGGGESGGGGGESGGGGGESGGGGGAGGIGFFAMHPGWSDTEAVKSALPGFYSSLKARRRCEFELGLTHEVERRLCGFKQLKHVIRKKKWFQMFPHKYFLTNISFQIQLVPPATSRRGFALHGGVVCKLNLVGPVSLKGARFQMVKGAN